MLVEGQGMKLWTRVRFDGKPIHTGGTSKADRSRHGFGTMSMRYIAESYGGHLQTHTEGRLYCLTVTLPLIKKL